MNDAAIRIAATKLQQKNMINVTMNFQQRPQSLNDDKFEQPVGFKVMMNFEQPSVRI